MELRRSVPAAEWSAIHAPPRPPLGPPWSASATPRRPDERFPMNRTASIGSCVGPAVISSRLTGWLGSVVSKRPLFLVAGWWGSGGSSGGDVEMVGMTTRSPERRWCPLRARQVAPWTGRPARDGSTGSSISLLHATHLRAGRPVHGAIRFLPRTPRFTRETHAIPPYHTSLPTPRRGVVSLRTLTSEITPLHMARTRRNLGEALAGWSAAALLTGAAPGVLAQPNYGLDWSTIGHRRNGRRTHPRRRCGPPSASGASATSIG